MKSIWEVNLIVNGPIAVSNHIHLREPKGLNFEDQFYSNIQIQRRGNTGVEAIITARASTQSLAREAALHFFSQTIDILALYMNLPLELTSYDDRNRLSRHNERRILSADEFRWAFREARTLVYTERTFLRAIGWYRKGLITEDPYDKFLAFYNAIEIVANKYYPKDKCSKKGEGSICHIWECFKTVWETNCESWPIIPGDKNWIDNNNEIRNKIAHGAFPITVEAVSQVSEKLNILERVSRKFLLDWRKNKLKVDIPPAIADLYQIDLPEIATEY